MGHQSNHGKPPQQSALRQGRWSDPGQVYLVTSGVCRREPLFVDATLAIAACRSFRAGPRGGELLAWVLMPDHAHWLLRLGSEPLARMVWRLKSDSARAVQRQRGRSGAVWQRGYHDRALRSGLSIKQAARYIVLNPVRAGLVRRPGDYSFWNAIWIE